MKRDHDEYESDSLLLILDSHRRSHGFQYQWLKEPQGTRIPLFCVRLVCSFDVASGLQIVLGLRFRILFHALQIANSLIDLGKFPVVSICIYGEVCLCVFCTLARKPVRLADVSPPGLITSIKEGEEYRNTGVVAPFSGRKRGVGWKFPAAVR